MTGHELIRRLREFARSQGVDFHVEVYRGKGSHQMIHFGWRRTIIPDPRRDMRPGTLAQILKQLGIRRDAWKEQ